MSARIARREADTPTAPEVPAGPPPKAAPEHRLRAAAPAATSPRKAPAARRPAGLNFFPAPPSPAEQQAPARQAPGSAATMAAQALPLAGGLPPEQQAAVIDQALMPSLMASALGMDGCFTGSGYRAYLDNVRAGSGRPTDPVEVMLLEQLAMAHFRAAQLQAQAGAAEGIEAIRLYNSAAARLLCEFRQTALALKAYREQPPRRDQERDPTQPGHPKTM